MKKYKKARIIGIVIGVIVILTAIAIPAVKAWLFPPYTPTPPTGELTVQTHIFTWEDKERIETFSDTGENRALTVMFWYPEEDGEYPLVVFSHGAFGIVESNYSTCAELASRGYVVASIAHPYHAMLVEDVNGKKTFVDMDFLKQIYADGGADTPEAEKRVYEFSREWIALRSGDMNFVLDMILEKAQVAKNSSESPDVENNSQETDNTIDTQIFAKVDTEKIGLFGHSMGGAAAVQMGRERSDIDAVIDLEGTMAGEYVGFDDKTGFEIYNENPYQVPVLDINSAAVRQEIEKIEDSHPGWEYVNDYMGRNATDYREVIFHGAGHLNFTDLPLFSPVLAGLLGVGEVDARTCIDNVNYVVLTFFDYYLKGEGSPDDIKAEY